jgi:hypothetical protein
VIDLSAQQPNPPPDAIRVDRKTGARKVIPRALAKRGRVVVRDPATITGITLHQTACYFGPGKLRAGETRADAIHRRALGVHAHLTAFGSTGEAVLAYPREWYVYHGHAFCAADIGHEHEGLFTAEGDLLNAPLDYSLERMVTAGREAIVAACEALPSLRYIHLHRQTSTKVACPGRFITREIGMWAAKRCGLHFEPARTERNGTPIPASWLA